MYIYVYLCVRKYTLHVMTLFSFLLFFLEGGGLGVGNAKMYALFTYSYIQVILYHILYPAVINSFPLYFSKTERTSLDFETGNIVCCDCCTLL